MMYGKIDNFIKIIEKKKEKDLDNLKNELLKSKEVIKKEYNKELARKKGEIMHLNNSDIQNQKNKLLFEYNIKSLELKEDAKNKIVDLLLKKAINKIKNWKLKKNKDYASFINNLILKSIKSLEKDKISVQLAKNDSWIKNKLINVKKYKISFLKQGNFDYGVKVYSNNMKELIDNSLSKLLAEKHHKLYNLVDEALKWEK